MRSYHRDQYNRLVSEDHPLPEVEDIPLLNIQMAEQPENTMRDYLNPEKNAQTSCIVFPEMSLQIHLVLSLIISLCSHISMAGTKRVLMHICGTLMKSWELL